MAMQERRAKVTWEGNLTKGRGSLAFGSGALPDSAVTWAARTERSDGKTSPEELLAAAEAACFSMAFSNALDKAGHAPERLMVEAVCELDRKPEGGLKITTMSLIVHGRVPGLAQSEFTRLADQAARDCPVSTALHGNVEIHVNARLEVPAEAASTPG